MADADAGQMFLNLVRAPVLFLVRMFDAEQSCRGLEWKAALAVLRRPLTVVMPILD